MTWAKNYGDRFKTFGLPDKRVKAIEKLCAGCGTGIGTRKTYCGPCYDVRLQSNIEKNRARYKAARWRTPVSEREEWADLIRNEYDPAPAHYRMGDDWDDGAGRIADAILADKMLLERRHAEELEAAKAVNSHDALVKALTDIAAMDSKGIRADDLGRAARIATDVLARVGKQQDQENASE